MQGAQNIEKKCSFALKLINAIAKKQMHDSAKNMLQKSGIVLYRCF